MSRKFKENIGSYIFKEENKEMKESVCIKMLKRCCVHSIFYEAGAVYNLDKDSIVLKCLVQDIDYTKVG